MDKGRMKAEIYINRHHIAHNKKLKQENPELSFNELPIKPVIAVRTYKGVEYAHAIYIDKGVLVYDPDNARCSGATAWIEAQRKDLDFRPVEKPQ